MAKEVAIVTGAASGMGRVMALGLSEAGFDVVAVDRNASALATLPAPIKPVAVDLAQPSSFDRVVSETLGAFGRIDVLVNNAGIGQAGIKADQRRNPLRFWEVTPEQWSQFQAVNATSPIMMARAVVPHMLKAGRGRIITVTTSLGTMVREGYLLYGANKASAEAAMAVLAADLAGTGVTSNVLVPGGMTDTPLVGDGGRPRRRCCGRRSWCRRCSGWCRTPPPASAPGVSSRPTGTRGCRQCRPRKPPVPRSPGSASPACRSSRSRGTGIMRGLQDKVAIVTGGGGGIGGATCRRFAEAGTTVAVFDIDGAAAERVAARDRRRRHRRHLRHHRPCRRDPGRQRGRSALRPRSTSWSTTPAGMCSGCSRTARPADWQKLISINLVGALNMHHAVLPGMIARGGGTDRQHRLRRGARRLVGRGRLFRLQGRPDRVLEDPRTRTRAPPDQRQRRLPGRHPHRPVRGTTSRAPAIPTSWRKRSGARSRWAGSASPRTCQARSCSSPATTQRSSPARCISVSGGLTMAG